MVAEKRGTSEPSLDVLNVNDETETQIIEFADFAPNPEEICIQAERQRIISTAVERPNTQTPEGDGVARVLDKRGSGTYGVFCGGRQCPPVPRTNEVAVDAEAVYRVQTGISERAASPSMGSSSHANRQERLGSKLDPAAVND